ncbi:MAG: hypothetical protein CMJ31_01400 [Phycisphaerae bacterium]|nr:hypothetical protein [Phycisphaerae bacterium]
MTPDPSIAQPLAPAEAVRTPLSLRSEAGVSIQAQVVDSGAGPRAVFLHGLVGLNEHWELVVDRVQGEMRCTRLELPLLSLNGSDCSIQGVEALTVQYLDEHVSEPVVLVGNSFGGHVALRIALRRPDLVRGLVLAGSSGLFERTLVKGAPIHPSREWVAEKIAELFYDPSKMMDDDIDRAHAVLTTRQGKRAMVRLSKTARRNNLADRMNEIEQPTMLIWGRQDVVTPPSAAQGFLDLLPNAEIVWVEGCGHTPMLEAPDVFAESLIDFMGRLPSGG